jgi:alpha-N-arabinofuranosidase
LSWHYYTHYPSWPKKGPALAGDAESWHGLLASAAKLDEILKRADEILQQYDPQNRVGIYFDEWGAWHHTEQGDSALFQQNTIRDALVAAVSLDIFNNHCRRVRMANIAQTVNVLQSIILTEAGGSNRMLLTPTYYVFEMYKPHMNATMLPIDIELPAYEMNGGSIAQISGSASIDEQHRVHVSISNLHHDQEIEIHCDIRGRPPSLSGGRILTADSLNAHNTFDRPSQVTPVDLRDADSTADGVRLRLPARSLAVLTLQLS